MKTIVKTFSDGGNQSLRYISAEIKKYAEYNNLEIINVTNPIQFTFSDGTVTECMTVFKKTK